MHQEYDGLCVDVRLKRRSKKRDKIVGRNKHDKLLQKIAKGTTNKKNKEAPKVRQHKKVLSDRTTKSSEKTEFTVHDTWTNSDGAMDECGKHISWMDWWQNGIQIQNPSARKERKQRGLYVSDTCDSVYDAYDRWYDDYVERHGENVFGPYCTGCCNPINNWIDHVGCCVAFKK